jgi:hypothetical protein
MSSDITAQIQSVAAKVESDITAKIPAWRAVRDPVAFRAVELEIAALGREASDAITGLVLKHIVADPVLQVEASQAARQGGKFRHGGIRDVIVTLLGSSQVRLQVEYVRPNHRGNRRRPGRRRKVGQRGKGGAGFYPVLAALGIWFGVTPALGGEVCRQVADSDSVRAGRDALERRGINLSQRRTLRIVNKYSGRAVEQREQWLQQVRNNPPVRGVLQGKRVVIATDGGRIRERLPYARGRRLANGHRRYEAPWREPKLLTVYVIGDDGTIENSFQPVYDGTLGDADAVFDMLVGYLKALGAHEVRHLILVGDGAKWIWERAEKLAKRLGLDADQVTQVIDWCHAVGVLHEIAEVPANWSENDKQKWIRRAKNHLHAGEIDELVAQMDALAVGRRAKDISEHRDYFVRNAKRMQYAAFEAAHIPTGSGAIESAVRRVVNMRMKSNGMFWLEVNAEGMLLLRSYLKSGYFDTLIDWSLLRSIPWWRSPMATPIPSTPVDLRRAA